MWSGIVTQSNPRPSAACAMSFSCGHSALPNCAPNSIRGLLSRAVVPREEEPTPSGGATSLQGVLCGSGRARPPLEQMRDRPDEGERPGDERDGDEDPRNGHQEL